jgi:hypothetical protein
VASAMMHKAQAQRRVWAVMLPPAQGVVSALATAQNPSAGSGLPGHAR